MPTSRSTPSRCSRTAAGASARRGKDNGLLIVVAVEDRKVGIEVGYGLEGFITDGFAGQTIREAILPQFREQQYGRGLLAGADAHHQPHRRGTRRAAAGRAGRDAGSGRPPVQRTSRTACASLLFILFIILMMQPAIAPARGGAGEAARGAAGTAAWVRSAAAWAASAAASAASVAGGGGGGGFGGFGGGRSGGGGASGGW